MIFVDDILNLHGLVALLGKMIQYIIESQRIHVLPVNNIDILGLVAQR